MGGLARRKQFSVTHYESDKCFNGYTYFDPFWEQSRSYLIDMQGNIVHYWEFPGMFGDWTELLPDGHLLVPVRMLNSDGPRFPGFCGATLYEFDWDGNVIWKYEDKYQHHTFRKVENGNYMILRVVAVPPDIAKRIPGGEPGTEDKGTMWTDSIREITPDGHVVWEWHVYEHIDPEKNPICPLEPRAEWTHANSLEILPDGNILTILRTQHLVIIIDKRTGDIKWQWGAGEIFHPHNCTMLENGNILVFDNGAHRWDSFIEYSTVTEVDPKTNKIVWQYKGDPLTDFYATVCSGCQRLPNGNTLICESGDARIFEVTKEKDIVWEYVNPFYSLNQKVDTSARDMGHTPWVHRASRFGPDYPAFVGKDLDPKRYEGLNQIYGPAISRQIS